MKRKINKTDIPFVYIPNMINMKEIENTILHGDCIEKLKELPSESVDLIFADPPYFMQTEGELMRPEGTTFSGVNDLWDKFNGYSQYDEFCLNWLTECKRVLKKNGSIWVIGSFQNIYRIGYIMQNLGFWILNDIVWSKPNAAPNFSGKRFQNSHETLLWCTKDKNAKYTFNYKTMKYLHGGKQEKSIWDIGICIGNERLKDKNKKKVHSTQKPEKLLYNIILSSSKPNDIILDPFFGTGTTGAVAKLLGRKYIGIEREKNYIKVAEERIEKIIPETNLITHLKLEVKPPKVPMEKLIEKNMLLVNQKLYDKAKKVSAKITATGYLDDGEEVKSIHLMSAKYLKKKNNNGWTFWYAERNGNLIPIDDLRTEYAQQFLEN